MLIHQQCRILPVLATICKLLKLDADFSEPFDLKEMDIQICFPDEYPLEVFTVEIPEDQDLPASMGRHVCMASEEWLRAKHATNRLMGKLELLFRPYLRWLDRNMEKLFTEGARQIKRELEAERAGIHIVPYQQLRARLPGAIPSQTTEMSAGPQKEDGSEELSQKLRDVKVAESESPEMSGTGSEISTSEEEDNCSRTGSPSGDRHELAGKSDPPIPCKGTAVRLVGLELGEGTATLSAQQITMSLKCSSPATPGICLVNLHYTPTLARPSFLRKETKTAHISPDCLEESNVAFPRLFTQVCCFGIILVDLCTLSKDLPSFLKC
eukprot:g44780.t1